MPKPGHFYTFCEGVFATGRGPWHIRWTNEGRRLGGGINSGSLCGHVKPRQGWDLDVALTEHHLGHTCKQCVELMRAGVQA